MLIQTEKKSFVGPNDIQPPQETGASITIKEAKKNQMAEKRNQIENVLSDTKNKNGESAKKERVKWKSVLVIKI